MERWPFRIVSKLLLKPLQADEATGDAPGDGVGGIEGAVVEEMPGDPVAGDQEIGDQFRTGEEGRLD